MVITFAAESTADCRAQQFSFNMLLAFLSILPKPFTIMILSKTTHTEKANEVFVVRTRPNLLENFKHGGNLLPNPWSINDIFGLRDVPLQIVRLICIVLRMMDKLEIPFFNSMLPCARTTPQLKHAQVFSKLLPILGFHNVTCETHGVLRGTHRFVDPYQLANGGINVVETNHFLSLNSCFKLAVVPDDEWDPVPPFPNIPFCSTQRATGSMPSIHCSDFVKSSVITRKDDDGLFCEILVFDHCYY